jgi:hypothetical protein
MFADVHTLLVMVVEIGDGEGNKCEGPAML